MEVFKALGASDAAGDPRMAQEPGRSRRRISRPRKSACASSTSRPAPEVSQSTASQFMATLQRAGLVTCTRVGQWSHYHRDEAAIAALGRKLTVEV